MSIVRYDAELRRHDEALRAALDIRSHGDVLDIGCGTGQTTRYAARTALSALGVDIRTAAIERARALAAAEALRNVSFECANAQDCGFPTQFDLAMSRFGTMFFADPGAAFANIGRALRPGGCLVMMVWQAPWRNEWDVVIRASLGIPAAADDAFSLADPAVVQEILHSAGFADIGFTDVHEPVYYGPDVAAALEWVRGFTCTNEFLHGLDPAAEARAIERLGDGLARHLSKDGVWFDSRAWIVSARRL